MKKFVNELRALNNLAKDRNKKVKICKEEQRRKKKEADKAWAKSKLDLVKDLARKAATNGKNGACIIAEMNYNDRTYLDKYYYLAKLCEERLGLKVSYRYEDDGVGVNSWKSFWVEW
jgi:hypothetical protein